MLSERIEKALAAVRDRTAFVPEIGIVLGSGLAPLAKTIVTEVDLPTQEIPGYPPSTVAGHEGRLLFGAVAGRAVVMLKGRIHAYEGYGLDEVVMPVRLMALLGAKILILTNAAGGIHRGFSAGDIMLIDDHLNLQGQSPLRGANVDAWGPRFPDMSVVYDAELRALAARVASRIGIDLKRGVYASLPGPQYETPAEVRMLAVLGADAVGMSTAPEAIAARHMGLRVLGFSVIANAAAGLSPTPLSHAEVMAAGHRVGETLSNYVVELLRSLDEATPGGPAPLTGASE